MVDHSQVPMLYYAPSILYKCSISSGTAANGVNFKAYLIKGLCGLDEYRVASAVTEKIQMSPHRVVHLLYTWHKASVTVSSTRKIYMYVL